MSCSNLLILNHDNVILYTSEDLQLILRTTILQKTATAYLKFSYVMLIITSSYLIHVIFVLTVLIILDFAEVLYFDEFFLIL